MLENRFISEELRSYIDGIWVGICLGMMYWNNVPFWRVIIYVTLGILAIYFSVLAINIIAFRIRERNK